MDMKHPEKDLLVDKQGHNLQQAAAFSLQTSSPEKLEEWVTPFSPLVRVQRLRKDFKAEVTATRMKNLALMMVDYASISVQGTEPRGYFSLNIPLQGFFKTFNTPFYDEVYCGQGEEPFDLEGDSGKVLVANFELKALKNYLERERLLGGGAPVFPLRLSMNDPQVAAFTGYLRRIHTDLISGNPLMWSLRVCAELENALFAALVEVGMGQGEGRSDKLASAGQPYLDQAEEFLRAHLEGPVSLHELAEMTGFSPRTLTRAFKAKHGIGPMGFFKSLRLEAAFGALRQAAPGQDTVLEIAIRYGFYSQGRFAAEYQQKFGEKPSQTLKR